MANAQRGRPWSDLGADADITEEAARLAQFLRERVTASGAGLRSLEGKMPYSRSQISRILGARVLPDEAFIDALLAATAGKDARTRETHRLRAEALLAEARAPRQASPPLSPEVAAEVAAVQTRHLQTYERLTQTLEQHNELREALSRSEKIVFVLSAMLQFQNQRIDTLTQERDGLLGSRAASVTEVQETLRLARDQGIRTREELQRAQQRQQRAEALLRRSQAEVKRLRGELERRGVGGTSTGGGIGDEPQAVSVPLHPAVASLDDSPAGADMARALDQAAAIGVEDKKILDQAEHRLAHSPFPRAALLEGLLEQLPEGAIAQAAAAALPHLDLPHDGDARRVLHDLSGRTVGRRVFCRLRRRRKPMAQGVAAAVISLAAGLALSTFGAPAHDDGKGGPVAKPSASVTPHASSPVSTGPLPLSPITMRLSMRLWTSADDTAQRTADLRKQIPRINAALKGQQPVMVLIFTSSPSESLGLASAMSQDLARLLPEEMTSMRQAQFKAYWRGGTSGSVQLEIYTPAGASVQPSASDPSPSS
ncbi:helix-turn-helix transcriptional regulator [Streptomyces sp. NPDC001586]|uniref:helix-turn-helix domain-containing protein n=1 Tax=Streptomyces sp. NPDC001586 TaxID=3154387 RepID=UPI00331FE177